MNIRLEMFKWRPGRVEEENEVRPKKRHMLSPGHVKDSFKTFFKARPDNKRFYILIYVTMLLMYYLPFFGEGAVSYNYVRTRWAMILITVETALIVILFRFHWGPIEYADYNSICSIIDIAGQAIFIPLLGMLRLPDANLIPFIIFTVFMRHMIKVK